MQFLPMVGTVFLKKAEQLIFSQQSGYSLSCFEKKVVRFDICNFDESEMITRSTEIESGDSV